MVCNVQNAIGKPRKPGSVARSGCLAEPSSRALSDIANVPPPVGLFRFAVWLVDCTGADAYDGGRPCGIEEAFYLRQRQRSCSQLRDS